MSLSRKIEIPRLRSQYRTIADIINGLALTRELTDLLEKILAAMVEHIEAVDRGTVMLSNQTSGKINLGAKKGIDLSHSDHLRDSFNKAVAGAVLDQSGEILLSTSEAILEFIKKYCSSNWAESEWCGKLKMPYSMLAIPLFAGERTYGVLLLENYHNTNMFAEEDLPFFRILANLLGLAIQRDHLENDLIVSNETREVERMRSELKATFSHELRMPLTAIKGYASALLMHEVAWSDEKQVEFLTLIEEECDHMQTMLADILDSSLIESDQLTLETQPVRLNRIATQVIAEMQRETNRHRLLVDLSQDFPIVEGDPIWVKQLFRNLLDNAIKYSPEGGLVVIRGEIRPEDVVISIADQGIGISPENMIPLFERHYRVESSSAHKPPGLGIGLQMARSIVEAHGGRIWAESKVGQGTTFSFSIPRLNLTPPDVEE